MIDIKNKNRQERAFRSSTRTICDHNRAFTRICSPKSAILTGSYKRRKTANLRTNFRNSGAISTKNNSLGTSINYGKTYAKKDKIKP